MPELLPILSCAEALRLEETRFKGDPASENAAMETAGQGIAAAILRDFPQFQSLPESLRILVLSGKGHNGADALIAVRHLCAVLPGSAVTVFTGRPRAELKPAVLAALGALEGTGCVQLVTEDIQAALQTGGRRGFDVAIDGLLGLRFQAPMRVPLAKAVEAVNTYPAITFRAAVDLPSGVGDRDGAMVFRADITYATGVAKAPLFEDVHQDFVGRIRLIDLGFFDDAEAKPETNPSLLRPDAFLRLQRPRRVQSNKHQYGHLLVVAGSVGMPGAAVLTTRGALRVGTGLVTTLTPGDLGASLAGAAPEAMWPPFPVRPGGLFDADTLRVVISGARPCGAVAVGPGLFVERNNVYILSRLVRELPKPLVLDASALTPDVVAAVLGRPDGAGPVIITPHMGEFQRLLGQRQIEDPGRLFVEFCRRHRVHGILKGPITWLTDGHRLEASIGGGPVLSRGGTGDILTGMVAGLFSADPQDPWRAMRTAVSWHAAAADHLAAERGMIAVTSGELLDRIGPVLRHPAR